MALRKNSGHNGAPRVRTPGPRDQPQPLPAPLPEESAPLARREDGTVANSEAARALGRRGGEAKANKKRFLQGLGLAVLADDALFKKYWDTAQAWVDAQLAETARCAGGYLGPGPSSMIGSAGMTLAASRYFSDLGVTTLEGHYFVTAAKLADQSKQQLLTAYELAVREGKAREALKETPALDAFEEALRRQQERESPSE